MAPIDVLYKWIQKANKGVATITTKTGVSVPVRKLRKLWKQIPSKDDAARQAFLAEHVTPLLGKAATSKVVAQPERKSGHDVRLVTREIVIAKSFKTKRKYDNTKKLLQATSKCKCTPEYIASEDSNRTIVMEDVGQSCQESKIRVTTLQKKAIISHFKKKHKVGIESNQVSPQNLCYRDGELVLIDVAKYKVL